MARLLLVRPGAGAPDVLPVECFRALTTARAFAAPGDPVAARLREEGYEVADLPEVAPAPATGEIRGRNLLGHQHGEVPAAARAAAERLAVLAAEHDEVAFICQDEDMVRAAFEVGLAGEVEIEVVIGRQPRGHRLLELVKVEERLRGPDGCPWDAEQTHATLAKHLVDETYELLEAIEDGTGDDLVEELGDLLLQVVFHAQIGVDQGTFDIDDVAEGIATKLVSRHPWVFGDTEVDGAAGALKHWDELKQQEKQRGTFEGVAEKLPALAYAQKLMRRAIAAGLDATDVEVVLARLNEATSRLGAGEDREAALGDILLAVVGLARALDVDAESALRRAARAYRDRLSDDG